ncbi:hypothetical protein Desmer_3326 [Desulfosporosinus meridiei DSM 13257]|uniref:Uncharacterized protein n=2 Tax=Desulfosporosinus TaxID=79206 RepID=J7IYH5_DESMD|nr:hypothetical protein Desmer_3326 [Desulfosporosinus meridiei DSM 13257]
MYSSLDTKDMGVTKCQLEIIIRSATDTEAEPLKSVLMTEEFTVVLLGMLTMTEYIYNRLVAQEIWAALATVGMVILVLVQELRLVQLPH